MAVIGSVEIDLVARVARLQTDLEKATGLIKGFKTSSEAHFGGVTSAVNNVRRSIAGLITVAGVTMLANFAKSVAETGDQLINTAKYLGITTDKLAAFQHLANLNGVSSDTMTTALGKFSKNLGDAADGTGATAQALKALGLSIEQLLSLSPDEAFLRVGDAVNKLGTAQEKAAATTAIFGKSAIGLINIFDQGRGGLEAAASEAKKFGLALSETDAKKIQEVDDAFDRLTASIKGTALSLVVDFSGAIKSAVESATNGIPKIKDAIDAVRRQFQTGEFFNTKTMTELAREYRATFEGGAKPLSSFLFGDVAKNNENKPQTQTLTKKKSGPVAIADNKDLEHTVDLMQSLRSAFEAASDETARLNALWQGGLMSVEAYEEQIKRVSEAFNTTQSPGTEGDDMVSAFRLRAAIVESEKSIHLDHLKALDDEMVANETAAAMDMSAVWYRHAEQVEAAEKLKRDAQQQAFGATASILGSLSSLVDGSSRKQFKMSQQLARAETIVATYAAASKAAASTPNPILNAALAAAAITAGLARLRVINSTTFGGGGGGGGSASGGGGGSAGSGGIGNFGPKPEEIKPASRGITNITVSGGISMLTDEIIQIIQDATANGDQVIFGPSSRNGQDIINAAVLAART